MARAELARFAVGRMGVSAGHSIDRREMAAMFRSSGEPDSAAREFFGAFERIYSFFAADDPHVMGALERYSGAEVSTPPFRPPGSGHMAELYLRSIDADPGEIRSRIDCTPDDRAAAEREIARVGLPKSGFILIFPGSGSAAKNWPAERFAALANKLGADCALAILGPAEADLAGFFPARGIASLSGLELGTLAAIAEIAGSFVGNDSGMSHLAAASGCRGVALFGATDPKRWRPLGDVIVLKRLPIESITVEEVLAALALA